MVPSEITFEKKKQPLQWQLRFTWEHAKDESHLLVQVLSILVINCVKKLT